MNIQEEIRNIKKEINTVPQEKGRQWDAVKYLGTHNECRKIKNAERQKIAKIWYKEHRDVSAKELEKLFSVCYKESSYETRAFASYNIQYNKQYRKEMSLKELEQWIGQLQGWAEIDTLCQSTFTAKEVVMRWKEWKALLSRMNSSKNIAHRRASLVLLIKTLREPELEEQQQFGLQQIEGVKHEQDILITKAVSWLLREMTKQYSEEVQEYITQNKNSLPAIAVRETERKLTTGKK